MKIVVGFSGGADSQAVALLARQQYPAEDVILLNADPGGNEHPLTMAFIRHYSETIFPVVTVHPIVADMAKGYSGGVRIYFYGTNSPTTFGARLALVLKFYKISYYVDCPHTEHEMISITKQILDLGSAAATSAAAGVPGAIVEAGSFHGGSTAKLSLVAKLCDRQLHVFDSFEGMRGKQQSGTWQEYLWPRASLSEGQSCRAV